MFPSCPWAKQTRPSTPGLPCNPLSCLSLAGITTGDHLGWCGAVLRYNPSSGEQKHSAALPHLQSVSLCSPVSPLQLQAVCGSGGLWVSDYQQQACGQAPDALWAWQCPQKLWLEVDSEAALGDPCRDHSTGGQG